ncbi:arabinosyltransferase ARAD1 [Pyrus ussuriensis x Pyrus communis]|uniref:Arabinosyltransferase ARAD1 n=1 Tax=Pyrus ussuriensis x Pyrus communis TaxID=2448454 RepID=A0A5N5GRR9_9ROSA|nr:arabinosyltransferase ARAD1 [Pyrus ussuriensis x Pyrus communis]
MAQKLSLLKQFLTMIVGILVLYAFLTCAATSNLENALRSFSTASNSISFDVFVYRKIQLNFLDKLVKDYLYDLGMRL